MLRCAVGGEVRLGRTIHFHLAQLVHDE